ncbi:MAG TPA: GAF domain-containing sensor histidine kinase, partial [Ardenticatenaceae bacterium]|nr:GAF domain-containing sensor histidine kinase [Ardenticatenaceae bacterium]
LRAGVGWKEGSVGHATVGAGTLSLSGYTLLRQAPVLVEDWRRENRFDQPPLLRDHGVICSLAVVIHGPDRPFGVLSVDSDALRPFSDDAVHFLQAVANVLAMAIERSHANRLLEQRVEERTREIERRRQVAEGLHEILTILNSNRALGEILNFILAQACRLLGASAGAIYRLRTAEGLLTIQAADGLAADHASLNLPANWGPVGQAVGQREPVQVSNSNLGAAGCERALAPDVLADLDSLTRCYRALLAVPLIVKADVYGAITLYEQQSRDFSDEEVGLVVALAAQAALAIENARLVAAVQGQAIVEERQRLARDLHDSVTQALYGVTLHADAAIRLLSAGDVSTAARYLRKVQDTAVEALEEMRLLIFELRPPLLEQAGLVAALQTRLDAVEGRANLHPKFSVSGVTQLPAPIEQALYRIALEALNNVLKHARARHISVSLQQEQGTVILEIRDDGVGFDPATARRNGGWGLAGIEERVVQLGGQWTLESTPGAGTQLRVEIGV